MDNLSTIAPPIERRLKPRMSCNYPAILKNQEGSDFLFEEKGTAVNLSRSGVYILLNREIPTGTELSMRITFPTGVLEPGAPKLALRGTVVRGVTHSEMLYGIGVKIQDFRFM